jgi:hypothetical protein
MGYRNYIGFIPKREYNKIKSLTLPELDKFYNIDNDSSDEDDYNHLSVYEFGKELHELGKYCNFNPPKTSIKPFFKNKELQKYYESDHEINVVTKEFLTYIIDSYREQIKTYYNEMIMPFLTEIRTDNGGRDKNASFLTSVKIDYGIETDNYKFDFTLITDEEQTALYKIIQHVRSMRFEWVQLSPYDLEDGDNITKSWKYEYVIFELVRIYKNFDWKRNVMIYYGY